VGDAGDGVAEGDVGEAVEDVLDVLAVLFGIEVVLFDEGAAGFAEAGEGFAPDVVISYGLVDVGVSFLVAEVCAEGVGGVVGEEFSFFEGVEVVGELESLDVGEGALEGGFVHGEGAVRLDGYLGGILFFHLVRDEGNHAADGCGDPAHVFLEHAVVWLREMPEYEALEMPAGIDDVLADDDVEVGDVSGIEPPLEGFGEGGRHLGEGVDANSGCEDVGGFYLFADAVNVFGINCPNAGD